MRNIILAVALLVLLNGCDLLKSEKEKAVEIEIIKDKIEKKQELEKLQIDTEKSIAFMEKEKDFEMKKSLALIEKEKTLESKRIDLALREKELELQNARAQAKLDHEKMMNEQNNLLRLEQYGFALLALIVVILALFIYYYFKKRREDELRAYSDNLEKYFHQKEDAARIKIAEKLLDTIATGKLNKEQEDRLISVFNSDKRENFSQNTEEAEILEIGDKKS